MDKNIRATLTFEMMGKPEEYLRESMEKFVENLKNELNIKILNKNVYPTKKVDSKDKEGNVLVQGDLFSTFSEVQIETESLVALFFLIFKYLPAHIEIEYPEEIQLTNIDMNNITNEIIARLHNYDALAKSAIINNQALANKLREVMQAQQQPKINAPKSSFEISYGKKSEDKEQKTEDKKQVAKSSKQKKSKK